MKQYYILILLFVIMLFGCKPEIVPEEYEYSYAHEEYLGSLEKAGLGETALGRDWKKISVQSLSNPVNIQLPFYEEFYLDPAAASGNAYRFEAKRGHRIEIEIDYKPIDSTLIFIDLFREISDEIKSWSPVASAGAGIYKLEFEPRKDNYYILRIQPELLRGGNFSARIIAKQVLKFPVLGANRRDIGSVFNAPRDGGRRRHHGVDIFASRHTPVIAPAHARVRRTGESRVGGRHVWLYDDQRSASYYFAHLQEIQSKENDIVNPGDTIGSVGNTGNARTTPPHLHFGIYLRGQGPVDPVVYILKTDTSPPKIRNSNLKLNEWISLSEDVEIDFHLTNNGEHDSLLNLNSKVKILGLYGNFCRIQLDNSIIARADSKNLR